MIRVSTPDLCDTYPDRVRVVQLLLNNYGGLKQFCGQIVTVKCSDDNSKVKEVVAQPGAGRIIVVDGSASTKTALLGDRLAEQAAANGWVGIVVNGAVRDVDELAEIEFGVQALGSCPLKTIQLGVGQMNVPLNFGGVRFSPGDYLYADNNGIICSDTPLF